jgi:hypothetical protein
VQPRAGQRDNPRGAPSFVPGVRQFASGFKCFQQMTTVADEPRQRCLRLSQCGPENLGNSDQAFRSLTPSRLYRGSWLSVEGQRVPSRKCSWEFRFCDKPVGDLSVLHCCGVAMTLFLESGGVKQRKVGVVKPAKTSIRVPRHRLILRRKPQHHRQVPRRYPDPGSRPAAVPRSHGRCVL